MKTSAIGWCDYSSGCLNFIGGCTPVSEGCANCFARRIYERFGRDFSKVQWRHDKLQALQRAKFPRWSPKRGCGHRPMAFVCDTGDMFHPAVVNNWSGRDFVFLAFGVMARRNDVEFFVLTKRPENIADVCSYAQSSFPEIFYDVTWPPSNIWLGVSVENQRWADERIPALIEAWPGHKFVSVEPMLEPIDLCGLVPCPRCTPTHYEPMLRWIEWVVCGAESGPNRRPFDPAWAADLYEQCKDANVPFFGKQTSGPRPGEPLLLPEYGIVQEWPR